MRNLAFTFLICFTSTSFSYGQAADWLPTVPVGNVEIRLDVLAGGFNGNSNGNNQILPTKVVAVPDGSGRIVVSTLGGFLRIMDADGNVSTANNSVYLDTNTSETSIQPFAFGLTSLAFHPDFANAGQPGFGKLYVLVTEAPKALNQYDFNVVIGDGNNHASVLVEYTVDASGIGGDALLTSGLGQNTTRRELLVAQQPDNEHNFGDLAFDENGLLYITTGDGFFEFNFAVNQEALNAQELGSILGKVLRIDPLGSNSANGNYGVVSDNFFAADGDPNTLAEIFSYGHRNPYRISFDQETGSVVVGEVGHFNIEEVNLSTNGENFGWPTMEGSFLINFDDGFDLTPDFDDVFATANGLTPPLFEYDHQDGNSVTGGFVYRGSEIPALRGKYIFADLQGGDVATGRRLFAGDMVTEQFEELIIVAGNGNLDQVVSFGQDEDGELYIVAINGNILAVNPIVLFGDVNQDGFVNLLDVQPFVDLISTGGFAQEADLNQDGAVNLLDVNPFIAVLSGS